MGLTMLGWVASIAKLAGWFLIGHKDKRGLILYLFGTALWILAATERLAWDLFFLEVVTFVVLVWNWSKWRRDEKDKTSVI